MTIQNTIKFLESELNNRNMKPIEKEEFIAEWAKKYSSRKLSKKDIIKHLDVMFWNDDNDLPF